MVRKVKEDKLKFHITENSTVIVERTISEEFDAEEYLRIITEKESFLEKAKEQEKTNIEGREKDEGILKQFKSIISQVETIRAKEMEKVDEFVNKNKKKE